jgi:hypothetical protein
MHRSAWMGMLALSLWAHPATGCKCDLSPACYEVSTTNVVFIGTVQSVEPVFLSQWNLGSVAALRSLNEAFFDAEQHPSAAALAKLKERYLDVFPEASADRKRDLQAAKSATSVSKLFYSNVGRGMHIHFQVQTLFKQEADDDDAGPAAKGKQEPPPTAFDVWTPFGDCGYSFQTGETYLVYASDDEETSDSLETDRCTRTRRVTEAGEDLAYLYFYKNQPKASSRVEGYTTTNPRYRIDLDLKHPDKLPTGVAGAIIELQSDQFTRFVESDTNGRFVFDGLPAGAYQVSAYSGGYPIEPRLISSPVKFRVDERSCSFQTLLVTQDKQ